MKLYICGNGFDLHHLLDTRYSDYKEFLSDHYPKILLDYEKFPNLNDCDKPWKDVENSLNIDFEEIFEDFIGDYYLDIHNESDSRWSELEIAVEEYTKFLYLFTGECFFEWITKLDYSKACADPKLRLSSNDLFVNFNYTDVIQRLYNIPDERVFHIHGAVNKVETSVLINSDVLPSVSPMFFEGLDVEVRRDTHNSGMVRDVIQFGATGVKPEDMYNGLKEKYEQEEFYKVSIEPALYILKSIAESTSKNIYKNYDKLSKFIGNNVIDEVIIMGHSLGENDMSYYTDILIPQFKNCKWVAVCYRGEESETVERIRRLENEYGIKIEIREW